MVKKMLGPFIFKVQIVFRPKIYVVEGFRLYITASFKALLLLVWLFLRAVSDKTRQTRTHASPLPSRISSILSQFALETCASAALRPTEEPTLPIIYAEIYCKFVMYFKIYFRIYSFFAIYSKTYS